MIPMHKRVRKNNANTIDKNECVVHSRRTKLENHKVSPKIKKTNPKTNKKTIHEKTTENEEDNIIVDNFKQNEEKVADKPQETSISIPPPPQGLAYIPLEIFETIMNSFEKETDKFKRDFDVFVRTNNIMYNNAIDWLEVDKYIHAYISKLMIDNRLDKCINDHSNIDAIILLIDYYKNDLYKDIFQNEYDVINFIRNNQNDARYDMVYSILKKISGHASHEEVMGF